MPRGLTHALSLSCPTIKLVECNWASSNDAPQGPTCAFGGEQVLASTVACSSCPFVHANTSRATRSLPCIHTVYMNTMANIKASYRAQRYASCDSARTLRCLLTNRPCSLHSSCSRSLEASWLLLSTWVVGLSLPQCPLLQHEHIWPLVSFHHLHHDTEFSLIGRLL